MSIFKNKKTIILFLSLFVYLIWSLIALRSNSNEKFSTAEKIANHKHITINKLKKQFGANEFNGDLKSVINKNVILDTTLINVYECQKEYFLKAKINFNSKEKFYVNLKCTKEIFERATKTKNNHIIIAAKIKNVVQTKIKMIADSLYGTKEILSQMNFLLFGDCLTLIETNYI